MKNTGIVFVLLSIVVASIMAPSYAEYPSPKKQLESGTAPQDILCNGDRVLVIRDAGPACVWEQTAHKKGWDAVMPDVPRSVVPVATAEPGSARIPPDLVDANNDFAVQFYRQVYGDENIFFSPIGMYVAFSMLYEETAEDTAVEIKDFFGLKADAAARHDDIANTLAYIDAYDERAFLDMANSIWIHRAPVSDEYVETIRGTYLADISTENFADPSTLDRINNWANDKTHGKIPRILETIPARTETILDEPSPDDEIQTYSIYHFSDIHIVLLNIMQFKGTWLTQFADTHKKTFWSNQDGVEADFMAVTGEFEYAGLEDASLLRMPYERERLSMLMVLPHERDGLGRLQANLTAEDIRQWNQELSVQTVTVSVPKFETRTNYGLDEYLPDLGMTTVFEEVQVIDPTSSVITLFGLDAIHSAHIQVTEEGAKDARTTMPDDGADNMPVSFDADHPFMFVIQDNDSGAILFMGSISDPTV